MKAGTLQAILAARSAKRPFVVATWLATGEQRAWSPDGETPEVSPTLVDAAADALRADRSRTLEVDGQRVFVQAFNPPLRLVVVGAVHITQALVHMAALLGYEVTVVDPRRSFATAERFPGVQLSDEWPDDALEALAIDSRTAVVTLTHDPKLDDPALAVALRSPAFYIGSLGSRRTHAARLERLAERGFGPDETARIHAPVGLDIAARTPGEIAAAIVGEVTAVLRRDARP